MGIFFNGWCVLGAVICEIFILVGPRGHYKMDKVNCFCCDRILDRESYVDNPLVISGVHGGIIFRATGNYGSTVFDPMPAGIEEILQVIICDDCVRTRA